MPASDNVTAPVSIPPRRCVYSIPVATWYVIVSYRIVLIGAGLCVKGILAEEYASSSEPWAVAYKKVLTPTALLRPPSVRSAFIC